MATESVMLNKYLESLNSFKSTDLKGIFQHNLWNNPQTNREINSKYARHTLLKLAKHFHELDPEQIEWDFLCNLAHTEQKFVVHLTKILYALLQKDLYEGKYKEKLHQVQELFVTSSRPPRAQYLQQFFCYDRLSKLYAFKETRKGPFRPLDFFFLDVNEGLWEPLCRFKVHELRLHRSNISNTFFERFEESLLPGITSIDDLSIETFFAQLKYFSNLTVQKDARKAIRTTADFYRFIDKNRSSKHLFTHNSVIPEALLCRKDFAERYLKGYRFHYLDNTSPVPKDDLWLLHINGHDRYSTQVRTNTITVFDFTVIESHFYREHAKAALWYKTTVGFRSIKEMALYLRHLNFLSTLKRSTDYETPNEDYFSITDAVSLKEYINHLDVGDSHKSSICTCIRSFLSYCSEKKVITIAPCSLEYLKNTNTVRNNNALPIPKKHMTMLMAEVIDRADESLKNKLYFVLMHLGAKTELRMSEICSLKLDALQPSGNKTRHYLVFHGKTTIGEKRKIVITTDTKRALEYAIEVTNPNRTLCNDPELRKYIFLVKRTKDAFRTIEPKDLTSFMKSCCLKLKLPLYTASNLRDSYMTSANNYLLELKKKGKKSDVTLPVLTGHSSPETAKRHYIQTQHKRHLEAVYRLKLDFTDTIKGRVLAPGQRYMDKEHSVEHQGGFCSSDSCRAKHVLSCFRCRHFVTTPKHRPYFETLIKDVDRVIQNAAYEHDAEDARQRKKIYVGIIASIDEFLLKNSDEQQ